MEWAMLRHLPPEDVRELPVPSRRRRFARREVAIALAAAVAAGLAVCAAAAGPPAPAQRTVFAVVSNDAGRYELALTLGRFDGVRTSAFPDPRAGRLRAGSRRIAVSAAPVAVSFRSRTPGRPVDVLWGSSTLNVYVVHRVPAALRRSRDAWIRRAWPAGCRHARTGAYAGWVASANRPAALAPGAARSPRIRFHSGWDVRARSSLDVLDSACGTGVPLVPAADAEAWRRLLRSRPAFVVLAHADPLAAGDDFDDPLARRAPVRPVDRCGEPHVGVWLLTAVGVARPGSPAPERLAPGSAACRLARAVFAFS